MSDLAGKYVVFIRTSRSSREAAYKSLFDLGVKIIMVHPESNWAAPYVWRWIFTETNNVNAMIEAVVQSLAEFNVDISGVLSFDEYGVLPAAELGLRLGVVACPATPEVVRCTNIKSEFRKWSHSVGLTSPKSWPLKAVEDLEGVLAQKKITYPCIVKPSPGAGSMLVERCTSESELRVSVKKIFSVLANSRDAHLWMTLGTTLHVLVEEYIGGQEVDIDCIVQNGEIKYMLISDNFETHPPYFVETGGLAPSALGDAEIEKLEDLVRCYVKNHGTKINAVLHYEAKYDFERKDAYVVEVNMRMGSAETYCLNLSAGKVNLAEEYVRLACGIPIANNLQSRRVPNEYYASTNFAPKAAGTLKLQSVPSDVLQDAGYIDHKLYYECGDRIDVPPVSSAALGWLVAKGSDPTKAVQLKDTLANKVLFEIQ